MITRRLATRAPTGWRKDLRQSRTPPSWWQRAIRQWGYTVSWWNAVHEVWLIHHGYVCSSLTHIWDWRPMTDGRSSAGRAAHSLIHSASRKQMLSAWQVTPLIHGEPAAPMTLRPVKLAVSIFPFWAWDLMVT